MSFGFETYNDDGTLQFSPVMTNLVIVASGSMTTVSNGYSGAPLVTSNCSVSYTRASSNHHPLIAIRPPSAATALYAISDGTTNTWTWNFVSAEAVGTSIPYWIFDKSLRVPQTDYGLQLFDASGNMTYHTSDKVLRIRDVKSGTFSYSVANTNTYESGRTYAGIQGKWTDAYLYRSVNDTSNHRAQGVYGTTDGLITGPISLVDGIAGDATSYASSVEQILIADVTNY